MVKNYKVTCSNCHKFEYIKIDAANNILWEKVKFIISGRYRLDMQWGWQCICGNNDITTKQEKAEIKNLQAPDPIDISKVIENLVPDKPKFDMVAI